jgi:hypothetical protein
MKMINKQLRAQLKQLHAELQQADAHDLQQREMLQARANDRANDIEQLRKVGGLCPRSCDPKNS